MHLSTRSAADKPNLCGITTASGKQCNAMQVLRAHDRLVYESTGAWA
jgi:hypothetical protein